MARTEIEGKGSKFIALSSTFLIIAGIYFGREVLVPLALAILISFLLTPPVLWLERLKLSRTPAVLVVVSIGLALVLSFGYVVGRQFASVLDQLPNYQGELRSKIEHLRGHGGFFKKLEKEANTIQSAASGTTQPATEPAEAAKSTHVPDELLDSHAPTTQPSTEHPLPVRIVQQSTPMEFVEQYAGTFLNPLTTAGLVLILVIFMLLQREDLRDRTIRLVGHGQLNLTTQALNDTGDRITRYLSALAIVNGLYGLAVALGLWLIGHFLGHGTPFPNVLVWALLVAVFRFIPYVGIWIGGAIPLLLSFALFPGSGVFFGTVGLFVVLELVVSQFIEPYWYGASTGMSALAVLVAAVFWTWLWGPIGLLLSTPLTTCLVVLGKYVPQLHFLDIILGDEPVLPPHVRVYQRLIASDEEEASELIRSLRDETSLESVYDDVVAPALALAELDHHRGDLDKERLAFTHQSIRDIVEELGDEGVADQKTKAAADEKKDQAQPSSATPDAKPARLRLPKDCVVNVLLLPARGESDQIVAIMLHQLLEMRGYCVETAGGALASEMVGMIESKKADIVAVSAMPPSAIAHARYLCKRIHGPYPEMVMAVGLWTTKADISKARKRIACAENVPVVTSLAQMQNEIDQMAHPIIVQKGEKRD